MKRTTGLLCFIFLISLYSSGYSHEYWIDVENFYPTKGERIKVMACSGHRFPESSEVLSERVFDGIKVIDPSGSEHTYETSVDEKLMARVAEVKVEDNGTYVITFALRRPPSRQQVYLAKSVVVVGNWSDTRQTFGSGLEFVVERDFSQIRVLYNGAPIATTVSVSVDGEDNFYLRSDRNGVIPLKITSSGKYLLTAYHKGTGVSLTFFVPKEKKR